MFFHGTQLLSRKTDFEIPRVAITERVNVRMHVERFPIHTARAIFRVNRGLFLARWQLGVS